MTTIEILTTTDHAIVIGRTRSIALSGVLLASYAAIAIAIIFAGLTVPFAPRLDARRPTRGLRIIERIDVYAAILWPGLLSLAILRRASSREKILYAS